MNMTNKDSKVERDVGEVTGKSGISVFLFGRKSDRKARKKNDAAEELFHKLNFLKRIDNSGKAVFKFWIIAIS